MTVTDPFSGNEHLNRVSASTTQGTCTTKAGTVECSVGTLAGESVGTRMEGAATAGSLVSQLATCRCRA